jgi:hypothetical protein
VLRPRPAVEDPDDHPCSVGSSRFGDPVRSGADEIGARVGERFPHRVGLDRDDARDRREVAEAVCGRGERHAAVDGAQPLAGGGGRDLLGDGGEHLGFAGLDVFFVLLLVGGAREWATGVRGPGGRQPGQRAAVGGDRLVVELHDDLDGRAVRAREQALV